MIIEACILICLGLNLLSHHFLRKRIDILEEIVLEQTERSDDE